MVKHLIGLVGTAESGKSTLSNYLHGVVLSKLHSEDNEKAIENWRLNEFGKLEIEVDTYNPDTLAFEKQFNVLDVDNRSTDFQMWARGAFWQFIKSFYLSYPLKRVCTSLLGLRHSQVYGSEKNTETQYTWNSFAHFLSIADKKYVKDNNLENVRLTAREVMEYFGTRLMRGVDEEIYVKRLVEQLQNENSHIGVITDIRRLNEAKTLKENGCTLIRLLRGKEPGISEIDINDIEPDYTIDNRDITQDQSCEIFNEIMTDLKIFDKE